MDLRLQRLLPRAHPASAGLVEQRAVLRIFRLGVLCVRLGDGDGRVFDRVCFCETAVWGGEG